MTRVVYFRLWLIRVLVAGFAGGLAASSAVSADLPEVRPAVVYDGPAALFEQNKDLLINEILELTRGEFDVRFDRDLIVDGNWDLQRIRTSVDRFLSDPSVDLVLCLGVMASSEASKYETLPKPVIVSSVYAEQLGEKPMRTSDHRKNLHAIISSGDFLSTLTRFLDFKAFKHLAVIVDRNVVDSVPGLEDYYEKIGKNLGIELELAVADQTAESVIDHLKTSVDGVLVAPLLSLPENELQRLIDGINRKKIPGFSLMGRSEVEKGLLAGLGQGVESIRLIRRIALEFQRILLGEDPVMDTLGPPAQVKIVINMTTADRIGFSPGWDVLDQAELIGETTGDYAIRNFSSVLADAVAKNPELEADRHRVAAGREEVNKARSYLVPNLTVESTHATIDQNRAELSFGTESERKWDGSLTATQVLFSEKAWSGWQSLKHVQQSRNHELEAFELDVGLDAAKAYLNVLRVQTLERILKNNLSLTEANLNRARTRQRVGTAGASEVYRWESEIAKQKKELYKAESAVRQAKNALSRILGEALDRDYALAEVTLKDPVLLISDPRFLPRVDNPERFRIFCDFLVREGLSAAPELKGLDAGEKAREQMAVSATRSFWLPEVVLQGQVSDVFERGGYSDVIDARDKTAWSVAVNASFPLFSGGGKTADYRKAEEELQKIRMDKVAVAARIEEGIRYLLHKAKASYLGIALARDAADAAQKNLELVTDAYSRGILSIIDLLDAQNASMMADLGADNAVYDFLVDMMGVQRSIGCLDFSRNKAAKDNFYQRLESFAVRSASPEQTKTSIKSDQQKAE